MPEPADSAGPTSTSSYAHPLARRRGDLNTHPARPRQGAWSPRSCQVTNGRGDTDTGIVHGPDGTRWSGARFHRDAQKSRQFQTRASLISGIVHLLFQSEADRDCAESTVGGDSRRLALAGRPPHPFQNIPARFRGFFSEPTDQWLSRGCILCVPRRAQITRTLVMKHCALVLMSQAPGGERPWHPRSGGEAQGGSRRR